MIFMKLRKQEKVRRLEYSELKSKIYMVMIKVNVRRLDFFEGIIGGQEIILSE